MRWMEGPAADAEALVGSLTGQPRLGEKEKARELSIPSLSSVPSTTLQRDVSVCRQVNIVTDDAIIALTNIDVINNNMAIATLSYCLNQGNSICPCTNCTT